MSAVHGGRRWVLRVEHGVVRNQDGHRDEVALTRRQIRVREALQGDSTRGERRRIPAVDDAWILGRGPGEVEEKLIAGDRGLDLDRKRAVASAVVVEE